MSEHTQILEMYQVRRHLTYADTLQVAGIDIFHRRGMNMEESDTDDNDDSEDDPEEKWEDGSEDDCGDSSEGVQELDTLYWNLNARFRDAPSKHELKPEGFDLINSRFLADGINKERWEPLVGEYKALLRPRGWLQMAEAQWLFGSRSGQDLPALTTWSETYYDGLGRMGKAPDIARRLEQIVRFAGFAQVSATTHDIQFESWRPGMHGCLLILTSFRVDRLTNVQRRRMMTGPPV